MTVGSGASPCPSCAVQRARPDPRVQALLAALRQRDKEVRAHEAAHVAAGGPYVRGGPAYQYTRGPDGRMYAVGGEVQIDTAPVPGDPEATVAKMQAVRRAALAPARPSAQDRAVAAKAAQIEMRARMERAQRSGDGNGETRGVRVDLRA